MRWWFEPLQRALPPRTGTDPRNALFDALIRQLDAGPLRWRLVLIVGQPEDPTRDATLPWPTNRRNVDAGILTLTGIETDGVGNAGDINFDPMVLPTGIEPSEDPLLSARSAAYAASYRLRTQETATEAPAVRVEEVTS